MVELHVVHDVFGACHEDQTTRDQAERCDQLRRRSGRVNRGGWLDVQRDVRDGSCQREATEQGAPLFVHLSRNH